MLSRHHTVAEVAEVAMLDNERDDQYIVNKGKGAIQGKIGRIKNIGTIHETRREIRHSQIIQAVGERYRHK